MVFDLGGGTFDLTIFRFTNSEDKLTFEVLATGGDDRLGGLDFDQALSDYIEQKAGLQLQKEPAENILKAKTALLEAAKEAKEILSFEETTDIIKPNILPGQHIEIEIERDEFEQCMARTLIKWTPSSILSLIKHRCLKVILTGSSKSAGQAVFRKLKRY